jgi:nucleoside-diphosphate-sugar epimerase
MSRSAALTGATGFIGGNLAHRLKAAGWNVRALRRPGSQTSHTAGAVDRWVGGSLEDIESLRSLARGVDLVVHCAGAVRGTTQSQFNRTNAEGVARLVQAACEQHRLPRFLFISSLAARSPELSPYAASKREGEAALAKHARGMQWVALRPPAVYGSGDREMRLLFRLAARGVVPVIGSDRARFSMLSVDDLASVVIRLAECREWRARVFEVHDGHPNGYTWREVIAIIGRITGRRIVGVKIPATLLKPVAGANLALARIFGYAPMITPGKIRELTHTNWVCDNTAIEQATGWQPSVSLQEGFARILLQR